MRCTEVSGAPDATIEIVDPGSLTTTFTLSVGEGTDPRDILLLGDHKAYVTRHESTHLLVVDPMTGVATDSVDLSIFADGDGIPEMGRMARDGDRIFVQIRRMDRNKFYVPVAPSHIAVVDAAERRLYVSAGGELVGPVGGIEEIDLDSLESLRFLVDETQTFSDIGGFVLTSPEKGFVVTHTDFGVSSHLRPFSRLTGQTTVDLYTGSGHTDEIAFDSVTGFVYFPEVTTPPLGVLVYDAVTDAQLTPSPIPVGGAPRALLVTRGGTATTLHELVREPPSVHRPIAVPHPFRERVTIHMGRSGANSTAQIYDIRGRLVRTLAPSTLHGGEAHAIWDGRDTGGRSVPPGAYFYVIPGVDEGRGRITHLR